MVSPAKNFTLDLTWAYGVVVSMFDFHCCSNHGEFHKHYTLVPSVNPTCHPSGVGKWAPVKLLGSNCGNTREWSGVIPYHLVEAIEKGAFGSPSTSVGQIELIE